MYIVLNKEFLYLHNQIYLLPMNKNLYPIWFLGLVFLGALVSCVQDELPLVDEPAQRTQDYRSTVALEWMTLLLDLERFTTGYRPPVSARAFGYIGLAGYEAVVPGMLDQYNSVAPELPGLVLPRIDRNQEYHWPTAIHAAYGSIMASFFPTAPALQQQRLFSLREKYNRIFQDELPADVFNRSLDWGTDVANAIFRWSVTDQNGHEAYLRNHDLNYVPPQGEHTWQPTYPDYTPALLPHWGAVRTFVASQDDNVPPPLPFSTSPNSQIYVQTTETMLKVNAIKAGGDFEEKWIAEFWSDDCPILTFTPAGRWVAVANQLTPAVSLDVAALTYAKVGMALCDAGIRCWSEKYRFNYLRPIDYIRRHMGDPEWNTIMCPDGSGNFFTPPFPAYPSGHATFGASAAEVFTSIYGINYAMSDRCHEGRTEFLSTPRAFPNFYTMAEENGYSRIPLGVHFRMDAEEGVRLGYRIGRKVNNLPWLK